MRAYVTLFCLSALFGVLLVPLAGKLSRRVGALSWPGGRNVNATAVPRLGGIAIAAACCLPLCILYFVEAQVARELRALGLLAPVALLGGLLLCVMGCVDDVRGMRAVHKLGVQVVAASLAYAAGFRIEAVSVPIVEAHLPMGIFSLPVTVLWIVGLTNALNLIDGLDGLAAGVAFFAGVTNFVVAYLSGSVFVAAFMAVMMGALIAFLFYNFNPARIFMGDSGSYFLGFLLATTSLQGASQKASTTVALLVPMVALGLPIFDTLFAMVRRFLERRPLFAPDRGHIHHRLLDIGLTHRRAVLILYGASIALTLSAIGISLGRNWAAGVAMVVVSVVLFGFVRLAHASRIVSAAHPGALTSDPSTVRVRRALPDLLRRLDAAQDESDLVQAVGRFSSEVGYASGALGVAHESLLTWGRAEQEEFVKTPNAGVCMALGGVGGWIRFYGASPEARMSREVRVLFEFVAEVVIEVLDRLESPIVGASSESGEERGSVASLEVALKRA